MIGGFVLAVPCSCHRGGMARPEWHLRSWGAIANLKTNLSDFWRRPSALYHTPNTPSHTQAPFKNTPFAPTPWSLAQRGLTWTKVSKEFGTSDFQGSFSAQWVTRWISKCSLLDCESRIKSWFSNPPSPPHQMKVLMCKKCLSRAKLDDTNTL